MDMEYPRAPYAETLVVIQAIMRIIRVNTADINGVSMETEDWYWAAFQDVPIAIANTPKQKKLLAAVVVARSFCPYACISVPSLKVTRKSSLL